MLQDKLPCHQTVIRHRHPPGVEPGVGPLLVYVRVVLLDLLDDGPKGCSRLELRNIQTGVMHFSPFGLVTLTSSTAFPSGDSVPIGGPSLEATVSEPCRLRPVLITSRSAHAGTTVSGSLSCDPG